MGAAADCERFGAGLLGQPVNSLTTIAFVAAGLYIISKRPIRWIGIGLIATGVGSFLFHGPMNSGAEWAHDVSLAWLILLIAGLGRIWEKWSRIPGLIVLGLVFAAFPDLADPFAVVLTAGALAGILTRDRTIQTVAPLALLAGLAILGRLGATGWPLCDPDSLLQLHGVWHVGAAAAVIWWALGYSRVQSTTRRL